jgi:hypothetical protein
MVPSECSRPPAVRDARIDHSPAVCEREGVRTLEETPLGVQAQIPCRLLSFDGDLHLAIDWTALRRMLY